VTTTEETALEVLKLRRELEDQQRSFSAQSQLLCSVVEAARSVEALFSTNHCEELESLRAELHALDTAPSQWEPEPQHGWRPPEDG